jgi:hypothetical protein
MDKSYNSGCRRRGFRRLVCVSARADRLASGKLQGYAVCRSAIFGKSTSTSVAVLK